MGFTFAKPLLIPANDGLLLPLSSLVMVSLVVSLKKEAVKQINEGEL